MLYIRTDADNTYVNQRVQFLLQRLVLCFVICGLFHNSVTQNVYHVLSLMELEVTYKIRQPLTMFLKNKDLHLIPSSAKSGKSK